MRTRGRWLGALLVVAGALLACKSGGKNIHKSSLVEMSGEDDEQKYSVELPKGAKLESGEWKLADDAVELRVSISANTVLRTKGFYEGNGTITQHTEVIDHESTDSSSFVVFYKPGSPSELWTTVHRKYTGSSAIGCVAILKYRDASAYEKVAHSNWLKKICRSAKRTDV
ncbi:MAG: hypothetical protein IPM35_36070 [Myxococcales bacterium]|nr:hypothetical protein [Myxococcales bacterium]